MTDTTRGLATAKPRPNTSDITDGLLEHAQRIDRIVDAGRGFPNRDEAAAAMLRGMAGIIEVLDQINGTLERYLSADRRRL